MKLDLEQAIKRGVEQAMTEYTLPIGMTLQEAVEKQIPKRPLFLFKSSVISPIVESDSLQTYSKIEGSMDPQRVPIINPSRGVKPIVVS